MALHLTASVAELGEVAQVPGPGPHGVARRAGATGDDVADDLEQREHPRLGKDSGQVPGPVRLEHGPEAVAQLEGSHPATDGFGVLRWRPAARCPMSGGHGLQVPHACCRRHHHPGPGDVGPPREVEVLPVETHEGVEAVERGEQVGSYQHAPAGREEDVADVVVLRLVELPALGQGHRRPPSVGAHPHLEKAGRLVPVEELGSDDPGVGPEGLLQHQPHGVRGEDHVVMAQEVMRGTLHELEGLVGRCGVTAIGGQAPHERVGQDARHACGGVFGAVGVDHQDREIRVVLRCERLERLFQPGPRVTRDDYGDDRRRLQRRVHVEPRLAGGHLGPAAYSGQVPARWAPVGRVPLRFARTWRTTAGDPPVTALDDVAKTVKEAAYVAVGFGVLGFQQAQVRRRGLTKQLQEQRPDLESQVAETRSQLADLARQVEQRLEPVVVDLSQRAEPVLEGIESRLSGQAREVWTQLRKAARETQEQLRVRRDQPEDDPPEAGE